MYETLETLYLYLNAVTMQYRKAGLFPRRKWSVLSFSRNFPDLKIQDPDNQKTHMSEISHKVYGCT